MFGKTFDIRIPGFDKDLISFIQEKNAIDFEIRNDVEVIIKEIRSKGDEAVVFATNKFDQRRAVSIEDLKINEEQIFESSQKVDKEIMDALYFSFERISSFHKKSFSKLPKNDDNEIGRVSRAIDDVLMYVPGGKASYPSTVLMCAGPAKSAGVRSLVLTTPCPSGTINELTLAAAHVAGIKEVYSIGGAQAIAAFGLGTESIPRVQKIVGPGNQYVAEAKRQLFGEVGIDSIAGPSEIVVVADNSSNPTTVAWDLMAQAEHDEQACSILISLSDKFIQAVNAIIKIEISQLSRSNIIKESLKKNGASFLVENTSQAADIVNQIAPEHLHLVTGSAEQDAKRITRSGLILVGEDSANSLSDYVLGPSHVLPTGGASSFSSPLSVEDFMVTSSYVHLDSAQDMQSYQQLLDTTIILANAEGLSAHAIAAQKRKK